MAQDQVVLQLRAAQVEVAVLEADVLGDFAVLVQGERQRLGAVEQLALGDLDLHLAGLHVRVDRPVRAGDDLALDGQDELVAHLFGHLVGTGAQLGVEDSWARPCGRAGR